MPCHPFFCPLRLFIGKHFTGLADDFDGLLFGQGSTLVIQQHLAGKLAANPRPVIINLTATAFESSAWLQKQMPSQISFFHLQSKAFHIVSFNPVAQFHISKERAIATKATG
jgi:hypothetical protein